MRLEPVQPSSLTSLKSLPTAWRLMMVLGTEDITVELHGFIHVGDELDRISKLCSLHFAPFYWTQC